MNSESIRINGKDFEWGMTLEQASVVFGSNIVSEPDCSEREFCITCNEVCSLKSLVCEFRAPSPNKPVMTLAFNLAVIKPGDFEQRHSPYVNHLTQLLGPPYSVTGERDSYQNYYTGNASGAVIYYCKWLLEGVTISLSVFGGLRTSEEGQYAAGLYFYWYDEQKAANPYYDEFISSSKALTESISDSIKMNLKQDQRPYYRLSSGPGGMDLPLEDTSLRTAQLILYGNRHYQTPKNISAGLKNNEVIIFKSVKNGIWCICNKWDFTPMATDSSVYFEDIRPAKGPGYSHLSINSFSVIDDSGSGLLKALSKKIEKLTDLTFKIIIDYDC